MSGEAHADDFSFTQIMRQAGEGQGTINPYADSELLGPAVLLKNLRSAIAFIRGFRFTRSKVGGQVAETASATLAEPNTGNVSMLAVPEELNTDEFWATHQVNLRYLQATRLATAIERVPGLEFSEQEYARQIHDIRWHMQPLEVVPQRSGRQNADFARLQAQLDAVVAGREAVRSRVFDSIGLGDADLPRLALESTLGVMQKIAVPSAPQPVAVHAAPVTVPVLG